MAFSASELLLPYQKAWFEDRSRVAICEKSRRTGLSWVEAAVQVMMASSSRKAGGKNCFYLSYNKDMTRQFIDDCRWWAEKIGVVAQSLEENIWPDPDNPDRDMLVFTLRFASGFSIQALPGKATALRSKQGRVCIDEAAFVEDLSKIIKAALALLMWGGEVRIISTHDGVDNPFNELLLECRAGKKKYSIHRIELDEALSQGLYKRICQVAGERWSAQKQEDWRTELLLEYGDGAQEELFCVPSSSGGKYFPRHLLEQCCNPTIGVIRNKLDDSFLQFSGEARNAYVEQFYKDKLHAEIKAVRRPVYLGRDFARSGDLSVIWLFEQQEGGDLISLLCLELRNWPFEQQKQLIQLSLEQLGFRFAMGAWDARGNGQEEAEYFAIRFPGQVLEVMATAKWYGDAFPRLRARFEDRAIVIPKDDYILGDFRIIELHKGLPRIAERTKDKDGKSKRHGDAAIAAVLAVYAYNEYEGGYVATDGAEIVEQSRWQDREADREADHEADYADEENRIDVWA